MTRAQFNGLAVLLIAFYAMTLTIDWHATCIRIQFMAKLNIDTLNPFQRAYLECALWSSNDNSDEQGGEPLDRNYDITDIAPESLAKMLADCDAFERHNSELLGQAGDRSQNGHDFWLTRNGHGVGFWDRGYGAIGDLLSTNCKAYGSCDIYPGDDGQLYI